MKRIGAIFMKDLGKTERLDPWGKADAVMLLLCFIAFAVLGYLLVNRILS
jgi:hypothetical protein